MSTTAMAIYRNGKRVSVIGFSGNEGGVIGLAISMKRAPGRDARVVSSVDVSGLIESGSARRGTRTRTRATVDAATGKINPGSARMVRWNHIRLKLGDELRIVRQDDVTVDQPIEQ